MKSPVFIGSLNTLYGREGLMWRQSFQGMAKVWVALCIGALPLSRVSVRGAVAGEDGRMMAGQV